MQAHILKYFLPISNNTRMAQSTEGGKLYAWTALIGDTNITEYHGKNAQ